MSVEIQTNAQKACSFKILRKLGFLISQYAILTVLIIGHIEVKQRPNNQAVTLAPFQFLKFFWKNLN